MGTRSPGRGPDPLLWAGGYPAQRTGQRLGQGKRSPSNNPIYKELPNGLLDVDRTQDQHRTFTTVRYWIAYLIAYVILRQEVH